MIELLVNQNFDEDIVDGLTRLDANLEFTYARQVDLAAAADETILDMNPGRWVANAAAQFVRFPCPALLYRLRAIEEEHELTLIYTDRNSHRLRHHAVGLTAFLRIGDRLRSNDCETAPRVNVDGFHV